MRDSEITLEELRERVRAFVSARDWTRYHHPKELAVSIAVEAAELMEIFQWEEKLPLSDLLADEELVGRVKDEMADVAIYLLSLANQLDLDVSAAVREKLTRNESRYPADEVRRTGRYRKDRWAGSGFGGLPAERE